MTENKNPTVNIIHFLLKNLRYRRPVATSASTGGRLVHFTLEPREILKGVQYQGKGVLKCHRYGILLIRHFILILTRNVLV